MIEPLVVDPSRLKDAGTILQGLVFPVPPSPIAATGTDSISAAINETLPIIESPVIEGLPAVKAAVTRTGSSITAGADMYAETDQTLGQYLSEVQLFGGAPPADGGLDDGFVAKAGDTKDDENKPKPKPSPTPDPAKIGQATGGIAQGVQGVQQGVQGLMQSVQGAMGSMPAGGAKGAELASDTKPDSDIKREQSLAEDSQLVDDTKKVDDTKNVDEDEPTLAEGAAPADQRSEGVPIQQPTPETAPSGIIL